LLVFLSAASFFEGYDFFALSQLLPNLRADLGVSVADSGKLVAFINCGTVLAFLVARLGDRWGRKPVLTLTIVGYTVFTVLSGLAPNVYVFAIAQMVARIFLIGEWATSMVIAAEEFPATSRGTVVGVVSAAGGFGSIVCAGVVPVLLHTHYGWRSVYFVGVGPLLILTFARRGLRETKRFLERSPSERDPSLFHIWFTRHRRRVIELAAIWFLTYVCTQNAVTFWKEFAMAERGFTDAQVGSCVKLAALVAMPLAFGAGKVLDVLGRKVGAILIYGALIIGVVGAYTADSNLLLTLSLMLAVVGINTVLTVLNAFTAELFPTEYRGAAFAWSNNLIGRIGYCSSPLILTPLCAVYGWGPPLAWSAAFPLVALVMLLVWLPETRGRELEDTSRVTA